MDISNIKLFFYGVGARTIKYLGVLGIFIGAFAILMVSDWISWAILIFGIAMTIFGYAMRFDYKRQSGNILYGGISKND